MRILLCFVFLMGSINVFAQSQPSATYAVVVGISEYANKGITKLRFANRDAEAFASYLQSKAGGSVPQENIRLLLDKNATTAAVYDALTWLTDICQQNDVVYFYFAGHGDMENQTMYKLGFLLTYNTPRTNYINNAVRIEDLNNFANTLSTKNKAKTILITDACHSGTLAGTDYRGNFLVGEQLRTSLANEIRITSCGPNELAMEHEAWGGGRGVFSFYFINGLIGFADKGKDGIVQMADMKLFLDSAFRNDSLLILEKHRQAPVLKGNDEVRLSTVDVTKMNEIRNQGENQVMMSMAVVAENTAQTPQQLMDNIFRSLNLLKLDTIFDFKKLSELPAAAIVQEFLAMYYASLVRDTVAKERYHISLTVKKMNELKAVEEQLLNDEGFKEEAERKIVILIHDKGQEVLNAYLEGDITELERRRYYNASNNSFDSYPFMFATARKLIRPTDFLYKILLVNEYYFGAVALITKIPLTEHPAPLITKAQELVMKAFDIEKEAPYIYNALGVLYYYQRDFAKAETNYTEAVKFAPQWNVAWSNLQALYIVTKEYTKAENAYTKAKELKTDFSNIYVNHASMREQQQQFLFAEEFYRKGIFYNSRHYLPFERLAVVYHHTGDYALADSFYYEADIRKRGYHFQPFFRAVIDAPAFEVILPPVICRFDSSAIRDDDVYAYFLWGWYHFKRGAYFAAEEKWKHVLQLDKKNPLAFHYLGYMFWLQQRYMETDIMFQYAIRNYLPKEQLLQYADSLRMLSVRPKFSDCEFISFEAAFYQREEDHYLLANAYERWNHYEEAEQQYRILMKLNPSFISSYVLLWRMLERIGRHDDAEWVIRAYMPYDEAQTNNELAAFYARTTTLYPDNGYWNLKAGDFFYALAKKDAALYGADRKTIFPDATEPEETVDFTNATRVWREKEDVPGVGKDVKLAAPIEKPMTKGIVFLLLADSLLGNNLSLSAAINDKIGDLYSWQGVPLYASVHYQRSIDFLQVNSGVRLKLVDACNTVYKYTSALEHLDTLKKRKEINFEKQLLLAKYYMHNSRFSEAEQLLTEAKNAHPYKIPQMLALFGRLYLLSDQPQKAITWFEEYLKIQQHDSLAMYSISRMYASMNNSNKAMEWLKKAMENGFVYGWVLKNDVLMKKLSNKNQWKELMKNRKFKTYPPPKNTYPRSTP
jgi:tetratricopeptide (TPR) repeat protein